MLWAPALCRPMRAVRAEGLLEVAQGEVVVVGVPAAQPREPRVGPGIGVVPRKHQAVIRKAWQL